MTHGNKLAHISSGTVLLRVFYPVCIATIWLACSHERTLTTGDLQAEVTRNSKLLEKNPRDTVALYNRAWYNLRLYRYEDVVADCDKAVEIAPSFADAYYLRGYAHSKKNSSLSSSYMALADFRRTVQLNPRHSKAWESIGCAYQEDKEYDSAIMYFDSAIIVDPVSATAYYGRGCVYNLKSQLDSALTDCERAITLNPGLADPYELRGSLRFKSGDYRGSILEYGRCISLSGDTAKARAYDGLAGVEHMLGLFDQEIRDYLHALRIDSTDAHAYYNLAKVTYFDKQDRVTAAMYYHGFLQYATSEDSSRIAYVHARLDSIARGIVAN